MLPQVLFDKHDGPFMWGVSDCVQWAADAVEIFSGTRPVLPEYSTEDEARNILAEHGGLSAMVENTLGNPISLAEAEAGDIVLSSFRDMGEVLGVADPPVFWLRGDRGFMPVELNLALKCWRCRKPQFLSY